MSEVMISPVPQLHEGLQNVDSYFPRSEVNACSTGDEIFGVLLMCVPVSPSGPSTCRRISRASGSPVARDRATPSRTKLVCA